jgi:hypothetical protein
MCIHLHLLKIQSGAEVTKQNSLWEIEESIHFMCASLNEDEVGEIKIYTVHMIKSG